MVDEVRTLLDKINASKSPLNKKKLPSAEVCVKNFLVHIKWLKNRHCKKTWSDDYIVSTCYNRTGWFKSETQVAAYCRINLLIATQQFEKLAKEMGNDKGVISHPKFKQYESIIRDYIFDLKPIAEYLERKKDNNYQFFSGQKYYGLMSWQIFVASRQLAAMSSDKSIQLDHKTSQITATFVLRQALEAKFNRLINVALLDRNGLSPRIKHDFNYGFIKNNLHFFRFKEVDFTLLGYIYNWCNQIVHTATQPLIWQLTYALDISHGLFASGKSDNGAWSINGGVTVLDTEEMQKKYINYFCDTYGHGIWSTVQQTPEALCNYLPIS